MLVTYRAYVSLFLYSWRAYLCVFPNLEVLHPEKHQGMAGQIQYHRKSSVTRTQRGPEQSVTKSDTKVRHFTDDKSQHGHFLKTILKEDILY